MPRQQRGKNYRGRIQVPNERPAPDAAWHPQSIVGTDVVCEIDPATADWQLSGIPALHCATPDQMPTGATLAGTTLTISYPAPPDPLAYFTLRSADGAVRGPFGEFLSAFFGQQVSVSLTPLTPTTIVGTFASFFLTQLAIDLFPTSGRAMLFVADQITNDAPANVVTSATIVNTQLVVDFTAPLLSGDTIAYPPILLATDFAGLFLLGQFSFVLP